MSSRHGAVEDNKLSLTVIEIIDILRDDVRDFVEIFLSFSSGFTNNIHCVFIFRQVSVGLHAYNKHLHIINIKNYYQ
jgi:hypothetical protein